ncbi:hypothetical protein U1Q18_044728 [Sarracenia purpurea var. burkii]
MHQCLSLEARGKHVTTVIDPYFAKCVPNVARQADDMNGASEQKLECLAGCCARFFPLAHQCRYLLCRVWHPLFFHDDLKLTKAEQDIEKRLQEGGPSFCVGSVDGSPVEEDRIGADIVCSSKVRAIKHESQVTKNRKTRESEDILKTETSTMQLKVDQADSSQHGQISRLGDVEFSFQLKQLREITDSLHRCEAVVKLSLPFFPREAGGLGRLLGLERLSYEYAEGVMEGTWGRIQRPRIDKRQRIASLCYTRMRVETRRSLPSLFRCDSVELAREGKLLRPKRMKEGLAHHCSSDMQEADLIRTSAGWEWHSDAVRTVQAFEEQRRRFRSSKVNGESSGRVTLSRQPTQTFATPTTYLLHLASNATPKETLLETWLGCGGRGNQHQVDGIGRWQSYIMMKTKGASNSTADRNISSVQVISETLQSSLSLPRPSPSAHRFSVAAIMPRARRPTYPPLTPRTLTHTPHEGGAKAQWLPSVQWDDHAHIQTLFSDRHLASVAVGRLNNEIAMSGDGVIAFDPPLGGTVSSIEAPPGEATLCWCPSGHRLIVNSSIGYRRDTRALIIDPLAFYRGPDDNQNDSITDGALSEAMESCIKTLVRNTRYTENNTVLEEARIKIREILGAARQDLAHSHWPRLPATVSLSFGAPGVSENGRLLFCIDQRKSVVVCTLKDDADQSPQQLFRLEGHTDAIMWVGGSPDGRLIGTSAWDATAKLWDASNGRLLHTLNNGSEAQNWAAAFSPDSETFVVGSGDSAARGYSTRTGEKLFVVRFEHHWIRTLHFSHNGKYLAAGCANGTVRMYDARKTVNTSHTPRGQTEPMQETGLHCLHSFKHDWFSGEGASPTDPDAKVSPAGQHCPFPWLEISHVEFSRDDRYLAFGAGRGAVVVYDLLKNTLCGLVPPAAAPFDNSKAESEQDQQHYWIGGHFAWMHGQQEQHRLATWVPGQKGVRIWRIDDSLPEDKEPAK